MLDDVIEIGESIGAMLSGAKSHANGDIAARGDHAPIQSGRLGPFPGGIYRLGASLDEVLVKCILAIWLAGAGAEQPHKIAFVFAE